MRNTFQIILGDAKKEVRNLKETVHCVVTSPPYFEQRKYGDNDREIGRERTASRFVDSLADVFDAIPLHPSGNLWVNLGDKRAKGGKGLQMIPERFAIEMLRRGWYLIDNVIWAKVVDEVDGTTIGGCMIEPTPGRLNGKGWESFYHFVKNPKQAWSDTHAIAIPRQEAHYSKLIRYLPKSCMTVNSAIDGRSLHNVWRIKPGQTKFEHFAVFPDELVERPIAMTCPMQVDKKTKEGRRRLTEMVEYDEGRDGRRSLGKYTAAEVEVSEDLKNKSGRDDIAKDYVARKPKTLGWTMKGQEFEPGIVLDPFCGSGTVGEVALKMGRSFIGIDLYSEFVDEANRRCQEAVDWIENIPIDHFKLQNAQSRHRGALRIF